MSSMYRSTLALDSKRRGVLRTASPRIRQAVSRAHALGGDEIPAPGKVPLKSSWQAALEAWTRNVGPGSTGLGAAALTEESETPGQCSVQRSVHPCSLSLPTSTWPKTPSRENSSAVATTRSHWPPTAAPVSQPRHRQHQRTASLCLHRLAISPTQITSHFRRRADTGLPCRSTRSTSWTTIHRTHAHIPHGTGHKRLHNGVNYRTIPANKTTANRKLPSPIYDRPAWRPLSSICGRPTSMTTSTMRKKSTCQTCARSTRSSSTRDTTTSSSSTACQSSTRRKSQSWSSSY